MLPSRRKCRRVIDQLRQMFPGKWTYAGQNLWEHEDGRSVSAFSFSAATNDFDVDSRFMTRYLFWDTQEEVVLDQSYRVYTC